MKTIYFVRHGESEVNVQNYKYGDEKSPLTVRGREQAERIAKRCAKLPIDIIITSTMLRAQETGAAIARENPVPVEESDLLKERKSPSTLLGTDRYQEPLLSKRDAWLRSFYVENERIEDGENFLLVRERAGKALEYLAKRPENNILVVAHGFILRTMLARVIFGDSVNTEELKQTMLRLRMENTGISMLHYDPDGREQYDNMRVSGWSVRVWNDHEHLG